MSSSMHVDQSTTTTVNWAQGEGVKPKTSEKVGELPGHEITRGPTGSLSVTNKTSSISTQQMGRKEGPIVKSLQSHTLTPQKSTKLDPQTPTSRTDQVGTKTLHVKNESTQINRIANQMLNQGFSYGLPTTTAENFVQQQYEHLTKDAEPPFTKEQAIGILKSAVHLSAIEPQETMKAEGQVETVKTPAWAEAMLGEINKLGISEDKHVKAPHTLPLEERVSSVAIDKLSTEQSSFAKGAKKVLNAIVTPFKALGRGISQLGSKISKAVSSHFEQREIQSTQKKNRELIEKQGSKWEIDDVHAEPKLFKAMEKFAQSRFQGEVFTFISGVKDLQNVQDPAAFKKGLDSLFDKSILGKEDKPGSSHQINIYPEHQKQLEALKNQDINSGNLSEVKTKLDSIMKEVLSAESMWSREIVGKFKTAHPQPTPKPTAPKTTAPKTTAPETTKTETPPKTEMSDVTKQQLDIIKKDGAKEEDITTAIKTIRDNAVASLPKNASPDDIAKAVAKELTSVLAQIKPPKDPPNPHLLANTLVSLALGKEILKPKNDNDVKDLTQVMSYITAKGVDQPGKCGADLWRTMNRIKITKGGEQILDGTKITREEGQKDKEHSMAMQKTLNLFFQHVTKTDTKDWIKETDIGGDQGGATTLGNNFKTKLTEANLDEGKVKTMQRLFGLGDQELFTRPGDWSIPTNFRRGEGQLAVSEFSGAYSKQMEPLQYSREIAINIRDDGKIEYIVTQPITFKDTGDAEPIGMCRMQSTFTFDENMNCIDMKQDVKQATRA